MPEALRLRRHAGRIKNAHILDRKPLLQGAVDLRVADANGGAVLQRELCDVPDDKIRLLHGICRHMQVFDRNRRGKCGRLLPEVRARTPLRIKRVPEFLRRLNANGKLGLLRRTLHPS